MGNSSTWKLLEPVMGTPLLNAEDKVGPLYFAELKIVDASV